MKTIDINADRFVRLLKALNYRINLLFQMFKADKINVNGDVDLSNTPIEEFVGNITINGNLKLNDTNLKKFNITKVNGYLSTYNTPYQKRKMKVQEKLRQREYERGGYLDNNFFNAFLQNDSLKSLFDDCENYYDCIDHIYSDTNDNFFEFTMTNGDGYLITTESESYNMAKEKYKELLDDIFPEMDISSYYIDYDSLRIDIRDLVYYDVEDEVRSDPENYFDDYDEYDETTHPSEDDIDEMIDDVAKERIDEIMDEIKDNPNKKTFNNYGLEIKEYFNEDKYINDIIYYDGPESILSSYDGSVIEVYYDDTWYNIYRTN